MGHMRCGLSVVEFESGRREKLMTLAAEPHDDKTPQEAIAIGEYLARSVVGLIRAEGEPEFMASIGLAIASPAVKVTFLEAVGRQIEAGL